MYPLPGPREMSILNERYGKKYEWMPSKYYYEYVSDRAGRSNRKPGFYSRLRTHWFLLALLPLGVPVFVREITGAQKVEIAWLLLTVFTVLFFSTTHFGFVFDYIFFKGDCIFVHLYLVQERGRRPVYDVELKKNICPYKVF